MMPTRSLSRKLTLIGHIARKHGLSIDSLLEAEMVLADGSRVRASTGWPSPDCGIWPRRVWPTEQPSGPRCRGAASFLGRCCARNGGGR